MAVSVDSPSQINVTLLKDQRVGGMPRMVFIALVGSLLLSLLTLILCCCSCYEKRKTKRKKPGRGGFHLLQQTDREHMTPVLIDSSSSDDELFVQHPKQQSFKLRPPSNHIGIGMDEGAAESSAFRPARPKGKVLGVRMGQYRDETSSSDELDDFNSPSPSSLEEEALVDLRQPRGPLL